MKVVHFNRKPQLHYNYSIEGFYKNLRFELSYNADIKKVDCIFKNSGFFRKLFNCIYVVFKQADVNHFTGDVNYLNLFFPEQKNIITILDCRLLQNTGGFRKQFLKFFLFSYPISRAKFTVVFSQATKNELLKYVKCNPEKVKVLHLSISPVFHRSDKIFNKQYPVILHIGTAPNKNLNRLIQAISKLKCKLNIVGILNPIDITRLIEHKIDYEVFSDIPDEELFEQYKTSDLVSFVSTYEGFGMPIIEANTVGRPVITSNIFSMPEVAADAALIVNPYDLDAIRKGILKIINDDNYRNNLIDNGFRNAERFSLKSISNQYFQLYQEISNNK